MDEKYSEIHYCNKCNTNSEFEMIGNYQKEENRNSEEYYTGLNYILYMCKKCMNPILVEEAFTSVEGMYYKNDLNYLYPNL